MRSTAISRPGSVETQATVERRPVGIRVSLFVFFTVFYGLASMGRFNSTDGRDMYNTAVSLLFRRSLAISPDVGTFIGRGGASYAKYGIGQSLAEMPMALLDYWAHQLGIFTTAPQFFGSMTNAWITAAGVVVLYQLARDLAFTPSVALTAALAYGLTTLAWVYAKLDFSEPLLTLLLLLAALACYRFKRSGNLRWLALAGVALGYAVLTKYVALALAPLFVVYVLLVWSASRRHAGPALARTWWKAPWARLALVLVSLGAPIAVGVAIALGVNWARSSSPWITGYVSYERPFNQSLPLTLHAAAALLVSPRYGLLFFATPVLLGVVGFSAFRRRVQLEAWGIAVLCAAIVLLYASYPTWFAGWTWGPRFLVPVVPFLMLLAAEIFARHTRSPRMTVFVWVALGLGFVEQLLGVLVNYRAGYDLLPWAQPQTAHIWEPWQSPLLSHLLLLPLSLLANLGVQLPAVGFAWAAASAALKELDRFFMFFWFGYFEQPVVALAIGTACALMPLAVSGYILIRQLITSSGDASADAPASAGQIIESESAGVVLSPR